ncbi:amino acid adenylation domain-containing protein [Endozoicomonas sp. SM1973]|uniref:Amino acid adenylation domain-containing protein n=1 Tax=Spartinivicinus marinus TaxID=2994442 RepID=A0A853I7U7_9GAMM|nr:non-ribosomal peptide synthetase [Spartinivicinus marinus]MCX4028170.1 amino acid adenylation domain-containing protein [Spartinivicinus marinus]NYZ66154.1 amino acid adenylation domain-containing protein [Spartinivicinus marinus]
MVARINLHLSQEEIFFDQVKNPKTTQWNIGNNIKITGFLDVEVFIEALNLAVDNLDLFQLKVNEHEGVPYLYKKHENNKSYIRQLDFSGKAQSSEQARAFIKDKFDTTFDLFSGKLFEFYLLKITNTEYWWCSRFHHILIDGFGISLFCKITAKLYTSIIEGKSTDWLQQTIPNYLDAIKHSRHYFNSEQYKEDSDYWMRKFDKLPDSLLSRKKHHKEFRSETIDIDLSESIRNQLQQLVNNHKSSLLQLTIAALSIYFTNAEGKQAPVFGIPLHNRLSKQQLQTVGMFTSLVPFCSKTNKSQTVQSLLADIKVIRKQDYSHQSFPLAHLKRLLAEKFSQSPEFFDVAVNYGKFDYQLELNGLKYSIEQIISRQKPLPLHVFWCDFGEHQSLTLKIIYRDDYLDKQEATLFANRLIHILQQFKSNIDCLINDIEIINPVEQALIQSWASSKQSATQDSDELNQQTIHQLFEDQVNCHSDAVAVVFGQQQLTYQALNYKANQLAHYLREQGVKPDTLVGLCVERSIEMVIGMLAIIKAGGAYLPIDPSYPKERQAYLLDDSKPLLLLTQKALLTELPDYSGNITCIDSDWVDIQCYPQQNLSVSGSLSNLAYVIYTSGSTGKPKGVAIEQSGIIRLVKNTNYISLSSADIIAQASNHSFDAATFEIWGALLNGAKLVCINKAVLLVPEALKEQLHRDKITTIFMTTALFNAVAEQLPDTFKPLTNVLFGGESASPNYINRVLKAGKPRHLLNVYGPTENTTFSTWYEIQSQQNSYPIGIPLSNSSAYVVSSKNNLCPVGVAGELLVGGVGVARGYLNRVELTAEKFIANPFSPESKSRLYRTGDLVRWLSDGNLEFLGRIDNQVKLRGFRIELGEIETLLEQHEQVTEAVVIIREDQPEDKRLVAYVVTAIEANKNTTILENELLQYLAGQLPEYMVPMAITQLSVLPLTENGKVDYRALPKPNYSQASDISMPTSPIEKSLASIWQQLLGIGRQLSLHDHFFNLGGHSLSAAKLASQVRQQFKVDIGIDIVFAQPTLGALANVIAKSKATELPQIHPTDRTKPLPLSYAQQRLWFVDQMEENSQQYHIPVTYHLSGSLDINALSEAFNQLFRRHESLRTVFQLNSGEAQQIIKPLPKNWQIAVTDLRDKNIEEQHQQIHSLNQQLHKIPFDLSHDLMLRAHLIRLQDYEAQLLITMHHIAADGWSVEILVNELNQLYSEVVAKHLPKLAELSIQYGDYAVWQKNWLRGEVLEKELAYWQQQLAGAPEVHNLPLDKPRPVIQQYQGKRVNLTVPASLTQQFERMCQKQEATLFMGLHAILSILINRYSGDTDIVIGTPVANREQAEIAPLIGFFVNTLVLRADLSAQMSFNQLLNKIKQTALAAYAHQQVPFDNIVEHLQPSRSLSYHPIFQIVLALQNNQQAELQFPGIKSKLLKPELFTAKFDLMLNIESSSAGFTLWWEYNTALFNHDSIEQLARHFNQLIEQVVSTPDLPFKQLSLLTKDERQSLLIDRSNVQSNYQGSQTIHRLFELQAVKAPDSIAVISEGQQLTYYQLNQQANQLAHFLQAKGVNTETIVGLCIDRSAEMLVSILAILKAGGAYLPLDPSYPQDRLTYILDDSKPLLLITQSNLSSKLPEYDGSLICIDTDWPKIQNYSDQNLPEKTSINKLAYVIYTSGSTGRPKGTLVPHKGIVRLVDNNQVLSFLSATTVTLQAASIAFDAATFEIWGALLNGGQVVLYGEDTVDIQLLETTINQYQINTVWLTAGLFDHFVQQSVTPLNSLRFLLAGGDVVSPESVYKLYQQHSHIQVINGYGPTENTTFTCCYPIPRHFNQSQALPIGKPIGSTHLYVLNEMLDLLPVGAIGELYVGGDGLAKGYLNRPELTSKQFIPHPFSSEPNARLYRTGDLVRWLPDGNLAFIGRVDHQVKIRGFRIELGEIEALIATHAQIHEVAVIAREDQPGDKRLVAYIVAEPTANFSILKNSLMKQLATQLPEYMVPAALVELTVMPLTTNGKVDRKALPKPDYREHSVLIEPVSPLQIALAQLWQQILGITDGLSVTDNFFSLGGHSLLAVKLIGIIRQQFNVDINVRDIFTAPTLIGLAEIIEKSGKVEQTTITVADRSLPLPLSYAQQRLWFIDQVEEGSEQYHMPYIYRLVGSLNKEALSQAFRKILLRHESLRTAFKLVDGEAQQYIQKLPDNWCMVITDLRSNSNSYQQMQLDKIKQQIHKTPYNLNQDLMLRVHLVQLKDQEALLLMNMHHVASDGWSVGVLINELNVLYNNICQGKAIEANLPELTIQYGDYAVWQRNWLQGDVLEQQLDYWQQQLLGMPEVHSLPLDKPRPAIQQYQGDRLICEVEIDQIRRLTALCQAQGATLFMGLHAVLAILMNRLSGETDIVIGTPVANREQAEVTSLIGFFVNALVLRSDLSSETSFKCVLKHSKQTALAAYSYQQVPFDHLVERLQPSRSLSYHPLFQVMLALQNNEQVAPALECISAELLKPDFPVAKFDLTLIAEERENSFGLTWEYNTAIFEAETITRFAKYFNQILEQAILTPDIPVTQLPLLSKQEAKQLLANFSPTTNAVINDSCIHHLFEQQADSTPEQTAVIFESQQLSYRQLNERANQLAYYLIDKGVTPGSFVGVCLPRSFDLITAILGILKAGGVYVPLDPNYPLDRLSFMIEDSKVKFVLMNKMLTDTSPLDQIQISQSNIIYVDEPEIIEKINQYPANNIPNTIVNIAGDDLAYIIYTSGSTGKPKGALVKHQGLVNILQTQQDKLQLSPISRVLQFASISFDAATWEWSMALTSGATLYLFPQSMIASLETISEQVARFELTHALLPPAVLPLLDENSWQSVKCLIIGGDSCPLGLANQWAQNRILFNAYGPTEATICATIARITENSPIVHIGKPFVGVEAYVLDNNLQVAPVGVPGELYIGGIGVAKGYLNRPELTAEKFIANPFSRDPDARLYATGDLVRWLPDGNLAFMGRIDHQVKIRGFRIELEEIEAQVLNCDGVKEAVVIAREDQPGDKRLVGYIVVDEYSSFTIIKPAILQQLTEQLPEYMIPSALVEVIALPLTPNGKVDRKALPKPVYQAESAIVDPESEVEVTLAELWQKVLGIDDKLSVNDNFFALGGHSLLAVRLSGLIRQKFNVDISVRNIFTAPTVATLAKCIEQARISEQPKIVSVDRSIPLPLSYAQQRLWFIDQMEEGSQQYHIPFIYRLTGKINYEALSQVFIKLLIRHESLRTVIRLHEGKAAQMVQPLPADWLLPVTDLKHYPTENQQEKVNALKQHLHKTRFDLSQDLMLRAHLVVLASDEALLLVTMHHIASDGWSVGILIDELNQLYNSLVIEDSTNLPELTIQYGDYAVWQRQWLQGEVLERELDYWKKQLAGIPEIHSLPLDKPRPVIQQFNGKHYFCEIDSELAKRFKTLCQTQGATLFMGLHAVLATLLSRYSGETDIVIGTPVANREQAEIASLIGFFVNTLVLRCDLSTELSFNELLNQCKQTALAAYAHQQVPFDHLVESLQPARSLSYHPVIQVMLALQNNQRSDLQFSGLSIASEPMELTASLFDLTLNVVEREGKFSLCWEYNTDLFYESTIENMARRFEKIMTFATARPGQSVFKLPILTNFEEQQLLNIHQQQTLLNNDEPICIHQLFEQIANQYPDTTAVVYGKQSVNYAVLNKMANRLAHYLVEQGVKPDNIVAICLERSIDLMIAILAILKAGGAYLPLDPTYPDERLNYMLEDSGVKQLITNKLLLDKLDCHHQHVVCIDEQDLQQLLVNYPENNINPEAINLASHHLAYLIYTSGSTGLPKGVMVEHQSLVNHINVVIKAYQVSPEDRVLQFFNIGFDAATEQFFVSFLAGATLYLHDKGLVTDKEFAKLLIESQLTHIDLPPLYAKEVLLPYVNDTEFWQQAKLHCVIVGGDVLPADFAKAWATSLANQHCQLVNIYGPTEATIASTYYIIPDNISYNSIPIGSNTAGSKLYVLDQYQSLVPVGVPGELYIGGDGVARGYLGRPELTAEKFIADPYADLKSTGDVKMYRTGDRVRWLPDGNLEFLGRIDNQVKIRGYRIELGEIETQLNLHDWVSDSVVVIYGSDGDEKKIVAYLVIGNDSDICQQMLQRELEAYLKQRLPDYMVPVCFMVIDQIPLTPNQKVNRKALPEPVFHSSQEAIETAETDLEQQLLVIWQTVLDGNKAFGTTDDFFALGGHSILAVRLVAAINKELDFKLSIQQLFANPTIRELAYFIEGSKNKEIGAEAKVNPLEYRQVIIDENLLSAIPDFSQPSTDFKRGFDHVLITGVTGFVGAYLLNKALTQWAKAVCYCVVRATDINEGFLRVKQNLQKFGLWQASYSDRIIVVLGDLNQERLGIVDSLWESLAEAIDLIVHNGAWVNHLLPYQQLKMANVNATLSLIELASKGGATRFAYISTTGIFSSQPGRDNVTETTSTESERQLVHSGYGASKWVAERLLLAAQQKGLDLFIFRLGRVAADSNTGQGAPDDVIGRYLRSCLMLGIFPDNLFEEPLITVDTVADAVIRMVGQHSQTLRVFHLIGSQTVDWNQVLAKNTTLTQVSWQEWLATAKSVVNENSNLPVAPYLHGIFDSTAKVASFSIDQELTEKSLGSQNITLSRVTDSMLNQYLSRLAETVDIVLEAI